MKGERTQIGKPRRHGARKPKRVKVESRSALPKQPSIREMEEAEREAYKRHPEDLREGALWEKVAGLAGLAGGWPGSAALVNTLTRSRRSKVRRVRKLGR